MTQNNAKGGGPPTGIAGGDLSGTYPNPTVTQARGLKSATTTISVSGATAPSTGQVLTATGSTTATWQTPGSGFTAGGDLTGSSSSQQVVSITGTGGIVNILATIKGNTSSPLHYGLTAITMTNADYTLTSSEQAFPIIAVQGGSTLTADRNIILPLVAGAMYEVFNFETAGFNLTFKGATGVGVTVPYDSRAIIVSDGVNYVPFSTVFGNASASVTSDISGTNQSQIVTQARGLKSATTTVSVSAATAPSSGQVLTATNSTTATWQTPASGFTAGGDLSGSSSSQNVIALHSATTSVNVASATAPSSGQVLTATSSTAATWQTPSTAPTGSAGGDLGGTYPNPTVVSITGGSGVVNVAATGNIITWATATTLPGIKQADNVTNSATGALLTIQAQNATGTTATGGTLKLTSGTGTTAAGPTILATGGTTRLTANATGVITIANLSTGVVHADSSGNLTSSTIVNADVSASAAVAVSKLAAGTSAQILLNTSTPTPTWTTVSGDGSIGATGVLQIDIARGLKSATTTVAVSSATAPSSGQVLTATSSTAATWQTPATGGGLTAPVTGTTTTKTTSYTITTSDYIIFCNNSGAMNLTLPAPANGSVYVIKDIAGTAETNNITLVRNGSEKIEGIAASRVLSTNWGKWTITSNGTDWFVVA